MKDLLKVELNTWDGKFKVACGNTTKEFTRVDRLKSSVIAGFALWCNDNEDVVRVVLHDEDVDGVSERILCYVAKFITDPGSLCFKEVDPVEVGGLEIHITDLYFNMLIDLYKGMFELSDEDINLLSLEYIKMRFNGSEA